MKHLISIVGPTSIGKSDVAVWLAGKMNGEIINSDSRQIYRYMSIGTAKPPLSDLQKVPHHLIDIVNPDKDYSLAIYQESAYTVIRDIINRSRIPFLVGGTGQYVWSVLEGWEIPQVKPDVEFRKTLEEKAKREGWENLYRELQRVDPVAAKNIMPTNVRRVIRALEIYKYSSTPASKLWQKKRTFFETTIVGLSMDRKTLYQKIDERVESMIRAGLVDEVKSLLSMGYGTELPSMSGIGYRQIAMYIKGDITLEEAVFRIKLETHRLARKQYAWFKPADKRIKWFDVSADIKDNIYNFLMEAINKQGGSGI